MDDLIEKIKNDDRQAFQELFQQQYTPLLGTALTMLKDIGKAKDVLQEVFFQIWKNRKTLQINSSIEGYLKRAVINRAINQIKARKKTTDTQSLAANSSSDASPIELLAAQDLDGVIQEALNTLPERCRMIFTMKRIDGMRLKEIAETLDISPKTVENQLTKALKVLRTAVLPYIQQNRGNP